MWNKPHFDLLPYSQITVTFTTALPSVSAAAAAFSLQAPTKFKAVKKKQFSAAVSNIEVGCERAPNHASWVGLQITVTAAKNIGHCF